MNLITRKQWTMVAGVSIFTFRTIESPITRALSSGFSVGVSLSGENLFNVLIGKEEWCFDPRLGCLTVIQLPCCMGSSGNEQCIWLPELVASKAVYTALIFLLSSTKVWMRVSSSKIFSVSLTISLHLSYVNPSLLTDIDKLYMWQTVQKTITGEEAITHRDWWMIPTYLTTYHCSSMKLWKTKREQNKTIKKKKTE